MPYLLCLHSIFRQWKVTHKAEIGLCCMELLPSTFQSRIGHKSWHSGSHELGEFMLKYDFNGESARWQSFGSLMEGDIIGCGVDYDSNTSFFTLNGKVYGKSIKKDLKGLLPRN